MQVCFEEIDHLNLNFLSFRKEINATLEPMIFK